MCIRDSYKIHRKKPVIDSRAMPRKKVVVTGMGALAPNGNSAILFWEALKSGISGIAPITYFDTEEHRVTIAGELTNFQPENYFEPKDIRKLDPFSIFALVAAQEAIESANLDFDAINLDRAGATIGTGVGGIQTLEHEHNNVEKRGPRRVSPQFVAKMIANIAGGHLSMRW